MGYRKITEDLFEDVNELSLANIQIQIDELQAIIVDIPNSELLEFGKMYHPIYQQQRPLVEQLRVLKNLKQSLKNIV